MTDNEIIKALERCKSENGNDCKNCQFANIIYRQGEGGCVNRLMSDSLDLINRQKATIERYEKTVGKLLVRDDGIVVGLANGNETEYIPEKVHVIWENMAVNRAKSEAIKEFAEQLRKRFYFINGHCVVNIAQINNLVKEMTEVSE